MADTGEAPRTEAGRALLDNPEMLLMSDGTEIFGINVGELELHIIAIEREAAAAPDSGTALPLDVRDLIERLAPEQPMNQDEQGGCVWCGGGPKPGLYAGPDPRDHTMDCPYIEARARLSSGSTPTALPLDVEWLERIRDLQPQAVAYIRAQGFVMDATGPLAADADDLTRWKVLAFSLYTDLVEASMAAERMLEEVAAPEGLSLDVERLAEAMNEWKYGPPGNPGPAAIEEAQRVADIYERLEPPRPDPITGELLYRVPADERASSGESGSPGEDPYPELTEAWKAVDLANVAESVAQEGLPE